MGEPFLSQSESLLVGHFEGLERDPEYMWSLPRKSWMDDIQFKTIACVSFHAVVTK